EGVLDALRANLPLAPDGGPTTLHSKTVLLLGAGGVARAVAYGLHREGALVTIANRTPGRAHRLAEEVGCRTGDWARRHSGLAGLLGDCTPGGTQPTVDEAT